MKPAPSLRVEPFADGIDEGGEVVARLLLELADAFRRRRHCLLPRRSRNVLGDDAQLGPGVERRQLHLEPPLELVLLRPDPGHGRSGVARDHGVSLATVEAGEPVEHLGDLGAWHDLLDARASRPPSRSARRSGAPAGSPPRPRGSPPASARRARRLPRPSAPSRSPCPRPRDGRRSRRPRRSPVLVPARAGRRRSRRTAPERSATNCAVVSTASQWLHVRARSSTSSPSRTSCGITPTYAARQVSTWISAIVRASSGVARPDRAITRRGCARRGRPRSERCRRPRTRPGRPAASARSRAARPCPSPTLIEERRGTPITGRCRVRGDDSGQRGGEAGAGDEHPQPSLAGRLCVLRDRVGLPVRREHLELEGDPALLEVVERRLHPREVGLRADENADEGTVSHRCRDDTARRGTRCAPRPRTRARAPRRGPGRRP